MNGQRPNPPRNHFGVRRGRSVQANITPVYHDRLPAKGNDAPRRSGDLGLRVRVRLPVHIGSGHFVLGDDGQAVKDVARLRGVPVLPGSSIKGMCRQIYELLTASPQATGREARLQRRGHLLTPAAALFGCLGYQGRASFDDAVPVDEVELKRMMISTAYPPKHATKDVYKFYGDLPPAAFQPRRIAAFAIPRGTVLETRLRLRNVTDAEIGDLLLSLGVGRFAPRIGGAKYDALGMVIFEVCSFRLHQGLLGERIESADSVAIVALVERMAQASTLRDAARLTLDQLGDKLPLPRKAGGP